MRALAVEQTTYFLQLRAVVCVVRGCRARSDEIRVNGVGAVTGGVRSWGAGVEVLERGTLVEGGEPVPKRGRHRGVVWIGNVGGGGAFGKGFDRLRLVRLFGRNESLAFLGLRKGFAAGSGFGIGDGDGIRGFVTAAERGVSTSGGIDGYFSQC